MLEAARRARIVAEPSGALPIAAWLRYGASLDRGGDIVMVVSGGNVDPAAYHRILGEAAVLAGVPDGGPDHDP
jgi:threonine dehydratase